MAPAEVLPTDGRIRHIEHLAPRAARSGDWPEWVDGRLRAAWTGIGIARPWVHQVLAAETAWAGSHVIMATGTASGKSLGYLMPVLTALLEGAGHPSGRGCTALYIAPTKALANDQSTKLGALGLDLLRAATYDGDTPADERRWLRAHANLILTNPDLLHHSLLPGHERWSQFLRTLKYVVVDECHIYRGVFGSHVACVLRRLRRVARRYGADPIFICASATASEPALTAERLIGASVTAVDDDAAPRGAMTFALWEPPLLPDGGEHGAATRRGVLAEGADLLTDLATRGVRTLAFTRSRRGAESLAMLVRERLDDIDPALVDRVAAYRGGYLPEERRALESALRTGDLRVLASTSALELGIDISGLDAVVTCGWPGTRAALWQQAGRAGRGATDSLAVFIARDDPLDTYLVAHPRTIFDRPVEASVFDPANPHVLGPHLAAAAAEIPLTEPELTEWFGSGARTVVDGLVADGLLRARPTGWYWTSSERASDLADLRGGGHTVRVAEAATGRLLGTVGAGQADLLVHEGAVYVHQGATFVITRLDLDDQIAIAEPRTVDYTTTARENSDVRIVETLRTRPWGPIEVSFGRVEVTAHVVAFARRRLVTGQLLGIEPLDLPERTLETTAVWWTVPDDELTAAGITPDAIGGSAHAAEHAAIGLLPLFATCDRWDIGGISTALHPDTGLCTIVIYDGHPGGAGFAERGFEVADRWLAATRAAMTACECAHGCPSCVQSPKCGNGNEPLDKHGAIALLARCLSHAAHSITPDPPAPMR